MASKPMNDDYPDQTQRSAICYSAWRKKNPSSKKPEKGKEAEVTYKQFELKALPDEERNAVIMASDESVDRSGDIIRSDGWILENFMKNGSVIYGHDKDKLPVAKPIEAKVADKQLMIKVKFADKGTSEWTDAVYSLVQQGILKGASVGFSSMEKEANKETGGRIFKKQELVELSLTPIPANANAMVVAKEFPVEIAKRLIEESEEDEILADAAELTEAIKSLRIWLTIEDSDDEPAEEQPTEEEAPPEEEQPAEEEAVDDGGKPEEDEEEPEDKLKAFFAKLGKALETPDEAQAAEPEPKFSEAEMKLLERLVTLK
jgi:HK97 family phage prohead protease